MVITNVNQVVYLGDGVTTAFPFTFRIIDATNIKLLLLDSDGTETDITSDYYVDTETNTVHYPGYAPGAEPALSDRPPVLAEGQKLVIYRELPITQEKNLGDKWPFPVIELALDKLTMILQQIFDWCGRTLKISQGGSVDGFDTNIYPEAGKVVAVNDAGNGFTSVTAMVEENNAWEGKGMQIKNIAGPTSVTDAATKDYVDQILNGFVLAGDSRTVPFDTLAQLRAADIAAGQIAFTLGYYDVNDGGAGVYNIRTATQTDTDNGGSIIILDNGNVAELIRPAVVTPMMFGAKGNANYYDWDNGEVYENIDLSSATIAPYFDNVGNKWYASAIFTDEGLYYRLGRYYYSDTVAEAPYQSNITGIWYESATFETEGTYVNPANGKHYVTYDEATQTYSTEAKYYDNINDKWYVTVTYSNEGLYTYNNKYWYIATPTEAPYKDNVAKKWYVTATYSNKANVCVDGVWYYNATFSVVATEDADAIQKAINYAEVVDGMGRGFKISPTEVFNVSSTLTFKGLSIFHNLHLRNMNLFLAPDVERGVCCIGINTDGYVELENIYINGNAPYQSVVTGDGANHGIASAVRGKEGKIHINNCTVQGARTDGISHRSGYMLLENSMIYDDGRNGITCDKSARIFNCTFDNKNAFRPPQYSIYHEPNEGYGFVTDIEIDSCHFVHADKCISLYPADSTSTLRNVTIENCVCKEGIPWSCVVSNPDGKVDNLLIKDNYNVGIAVNAGDGARVYFGKVTLDNNTGSRISIGSTANYTGIIDEITIKNTKFETNQIFCRTNPNRMILENCYFDKHSAGDSTTDRNQIYFPSSYNAAKNLYMKNCTFKNCRTVFSMYQFNGSGDVAILENCIFDNVYGVLSRPFKYVFLSNCMFGGVNNHVLSQNYLNKTVNATGCIFNQSKADAFYRCGTVTDVGCVYSYTE